MGKWKFPPVLSKPDTRIQYYENLVAAWKSKSNEQAAEIERLGASLITIDDLRREWKSDFYAKEIERDTLKERVQELEAGRIDKVFKERDELRTQLEDAQARIRSQEQEIFDSWAPNYQDACAQVSALKVKLAEAIDSRDVWIRRDDASSKRVGELLEQLATYEPKPVVVEMFTYATEEELDGYYHVKYGQDNLKLTFHDGKLVSAEVINQRESK